MAHNIESTDNLYWPHFGFSIIFFIPHIVITGKQEYLDDYLLILTWALTKNGWFHLACEAVKPYEW